MSSTRSCGSSSSSSSSTSNSNSNNHMPARRANSSRRTSESSSSSQQQLGTTTSTTTTSSSTARQQQHVADKSAVKRKKRRKDEDERVPVVLLTRLEDERKSNECKVKRVTEVKVVVERARDIESIRAPTLVDGKKTTRHPVHRSSENLANGDAKAAEPIRLELELKKVVAVVVEDAVKAQTKKSIESAKSSESRSSKVKSERKPADRSTERNVHNVNNDNNRKKIDPKITERQLLVKLDRSEVQNYLAAQKPVQRLRAEKEVVDKNENDKYHSESENQDDDVACKTSTETKTCAISSDDDEIHNDSVEKTPLDDATDRLKEVQKTNVKDKIKKVQKPDVTNKVKKVQKPDVTNKVKEVEKPDVTNEVKQVQKPDITNKVKKVQKPDVIDKVKEVQKPDVTYKMKEVQKPDITNKVKEAQKNDVEKPPVESAVKKRGRPRKDKNVEESAKSVVKNQRLSTSREKRKAKSQDDARKSDKANSDKDLGDDTKIHEVSSVQVNKNQTEHLDESPKDTSCESTKSSLSSESLKESAVVDSEQVSSETSKTDRVSNKIIESNSGGNNDSSVVAVTKPVPLPMEVDEIPHEPTVVDDSKAESESAQQICDIHSKNVDENAETLPEEAETVDKTTEEILSEPSTENLVEGENSESPLENLVSSDITECPAKSSEENETCESPTKNSQSSETSENLVNGEVESPAESFVSCENVESTNEESMSGENNEMIETLEDTESTASTCTLIEETPEDLSKELDDAQELPEDVEKPTEEPAEEDAHKEPGSIKELSEKEDDTASETSLKTDKLDESFSSDDKATETNEHESTFENNLKSVENLVIDSILNGEIVSPKMIVPSTASRVEQSFVFEGGVEDFVADIVASKAVNLEPSTPVEEVPSLVENIEPSPVVEAAPVAETAAPSVPIEEPALVESSVPLEDPAEPLPVEPLPSVEQQEPATEEETLESPPAIEEATTEEISEPAAPTEEPPVDEEFAKHRRKDAISELENMCEENIDQPEALEEVCNDVNAEREEDQQRPPPSTFGVENNSDVNDLQVPSSELVSSDCYPEPTAVGSDNYFENISDADSETCLADRLNQLADLKIPSFEETLPSEKSAMSDVDESSSSPSDHTKRQRILMKITKTDSNEHVTHLVESKEEEETLSNNDQFATDQVTEGEIKIIMRKESSSNNHVIKEIKIIPRTPEGNNSARIPGYSPTSSDLSSGNSSCRVPSCSPAKPDSGSYRMPGWSPASTEMGQTSTTATTKKKQGRPKKYPIFTDAELIAKTTAIVNNSDVHVASKLADKPLFEPVESIRINEDDEVERDDEDEEHQTVITEQTCLSGSQLLEAMPAQPEIAAELTRKIEEDQSAVKKKKKMGRPRKYPLPDEDVGTKSENVSVARIEFNVVDSIEEFVEPVKQIPSRPASPVKKRGRPRKYPLESAETSGVEESDSIVESVLIHEVPSDKKARNANSSMTENAERRARKPFKTLKDLLNKSPDIRPADDADSQTEDEAPVVEPYVERRGRRPWKHLKDLKRAADQENSTTENEVASDASPTKPYVERRGRKPWKHLKELNKLSGSQVAENSTTENEAASDASPVKPYVERRGRKPWKHMKDANVLVENQVADDADSQTEDEAPIVAPYVERRGRKPWKHLKNLDKSSENHVAEGADSQTEDEAPIVAPYVERRGRKPWKHLKNLDKLAENHVTEGADSQTEDEAPIAAPYVERRGRKPWKHLKNLDKSLESQVAQKDMSTTEYEAVSDASPTKIERRGRKPWKHLKNLDKSVENQVAEDADSQTEDEAPVAAPYVERRGRKPWKHLKNLDKSENQVTDDADSQTEDETPATAPYVERRGRKPWKHLKNLDKSSENQIAEDAESQTEDEAPVAAPYVERRGRKPWKHLKNLDKSENQVTEDGDSQTEDETPATAPYVERRGRKPWKHLKNLDKSSENQIVEDAESQTEDEAPVAAPYVERRGRKPWKHLKNLDKSENQVTEDGDSQTEDETPATAPYVERRGRKPWKHLKNLDKSSENQITEDAESQTEDEAPVAAPYVERRGRKPWKHLKNLDKSSENQIAEDAESQTEDEAPVAAPYVERRGRKPWKHLKNFDKSENQVSEDGDSQTEDETPATAPYVERRGRKPWKHLKHANESSENQVADQQNLESKVASDASPKKVERRGRKPTKHLKDANKLSESQEAEETNSQTEDETIQDNLETEQPVKKRRRRKSQKLAELSATEGATSMTEDESADDTPLIEKENAVVLSAEKTNSVTENESADGTVDDKPYVERRGRKPKHSKDPNKSTENKADEGADSQTEDETPVAAAYVERRGHKPSKHLKNLDNSSESQATEQDMSATETDVVSDASLIIVKKRGRPKKYRNDNLPNGKKKRGRPRLYPRISVNQASKEMSSVTLQYVQNAGEPSLINEDEPVKGHGAIEPVVQEKESASELTQDNEIAISENIVTEEPASNNENEIGSDTPLAEVMVEKKRNRKPLKDAEDIAVTSVAEEANSITEDESADEDALTGEQAAVVADKPAVVSSPEKKKRGKPPKNLAESDVSLLENQATEEANSMTDVPAVEPTVKKRGRPRKSSQDEAIPEIPAVVQDASPVTEDETVSSTEDIPTSGNLVQKRAKSISPVKIARNQVSEPPSSQTEDETVSSTEDIPTVEQQQPQPIVKKVKFAELPHTSDSSSTPFGSSVEDSTSTMEPPVVVKKRGRSKIARQADSTNESVDNTTEDETVSSTEDIPVGEQHVAKKKQGRPKKNPLLPPFELDAMNNSSLAASSVEDLSTFGLPAPKKRGRKPHPRPLDGDEDSSMAASSMEDLSTVVPPLVVKKKRGRKPRALMQNDSTCSDSIAASSMEDLMRLVQPPVLVKKRGRPPKIPRLPGDVSADSMEEFSPMKHLSPAKRKQWEKFAASFGHSIFDSNQQVAYDRSLSPVKKRGRPPKYPRENIEAPKRASIVENPAVISTPTTEQQQQEQPLLEKRKGRLPRRLSQDENFLPSILRNDKLMGRRASHDSGIIPVFSLSDGGETMPSLGKRQGRPPRKFSPDEEHVNHVQMGNESPKKLGRPPIIRKDDGLPMSQSSVSDSDDTSSGMTKRRGRPPKKFALKDGFTSSRETSPTKRRGRPPKSLQDLSLPLPQREPKEPAQDVSLPLVAPCVLSSSDDVKKTPTLSTTNLLRQQRKPKMAQPQQQPIAPPVVVQPVPQLNEPPPPSLPQPVPSPVKKRGRPKLLPTFDIDAKLQLPDGLTIEQLGRRRHSQDDSMFTTVAMPAMLAARPKEFEDAQPRKRRGRPPKVRELPQPFVLQPVKPAEKVPELVAPIASVEDSPKLKERLNRPQKPSSEKIVAPVQETTTTKLTAADFLRTWTDRDDSPAPQTTQQPAKKPGTRQRRFSQDFTLDESSRPSSRNRLRRYSQGDALDDASNDELRFNARKRLRSSGSDSSIVQDDKRPRVERDLCDQHSITKELVVQLTKIDKGEESPTAPCQQPQQLSISSDLVRMNLRRKLEGNNNAGSEPPPLVPIEPNRLQPPTHSDAKLLMLMQPSEDKTTTILQTTAAQSIQPPTQQFCIIFIPDALTSSESSLSKDSQPTATIVNFQPVPDSELANKSVIYTPTTPTKIFVNSSVEEQQRHRSFLCTTCTQALDLVGRLEANMGMTEEDKCVIKCPFCSNDFQSVFYLEYHLRQEHLKCENERQCRHPGFNTLRIPSHDAAASESEIYITFALKCRSCYELFDGVHSLNEHVRAKHANLIRLHKPPLLASGMICYPPPPPTSSPFKNGARPELLHCPSDCICRIGIRSTDSPMQRAQMLKRCPNFMRRLEKIEAAAYEVYTCTLCNSTFLMKDEVVEHLMKMHEVACKFPCTKCLASFRSVQLQEAHHCSETTIRDLDKLLNIVIMPTDKAHDASKFEDSSNDELGPIKTTPPPAVPSASTPMNGLKRKNGVVIQRLTRFLAMQPPKKPRLEPSAPGTPVTSKKRQKTPCPKCQKKFAYRKSLNDHIIFEHIIPCKADEASKNMAVELLRLINNGATDQSKIEELATALGKYTDDEGTSLKKLTLMDEQENWNEAQHDGEGDVMQCVKCKVGFRVPNTANVTRRNNHQRTQSPIPQLCDRCDPTRRRRSNAVNNGHKSNNAKPSVNGDQLRYTYECIQCGESFPTTIELNSHKSREHSARPNDAALKCDTCSKIFYSSRMLDKHKKLQHDASSSHDNDDNNSSRAEDDDESMNCSLNSQSGPMDTSKDSEAAMNDTANSSTTSRRDSSDGTNKDEEEACKCPRCDFSAEKVSLKNHLKREHGIMAFICQFCGKLLVEISEVRHMLDYHIKSSRKNGGVAATLSCGGDEVSELLRTLGKKRLQSLMIYHDFEGKCNNAIMRCPICPEQFATRESCRHHYQWMHDCTCILCDASFGGGNLAGQHKVAVHNSIASYVWAIQRLVSAIVHGLRLDRAHPSNVLYHEVSMRLDALEQQEIIESEMLAAARASSKTCEENVVVVPEPFLEPVVLSEDQLPGSGNMIEVVIGNDMVVEDSEDNLLENFYLSPNYESSCEQPRILDAGAPIPELEEEEEVVTTIAPIVNTCATIAIPTTPSITTSNGGILIPTTPVTAETYATSAVFKLRQDNGQEEVVLAITDEDLVTYRDDIGSLAEKLSATCDSLSLEEITTMLRSYFENVGTPQTEEVQVEQFAIEPRTQ